MFLLAIFLPPLAVLLEGKPIQAIVNLFLCFCFWLPGIIHALFVVSEAKSERRNEKLINAMSKNSEQLQGTIVETYDNNFVG